VEANVQRNNVQVLHSSQSGGYRLPGGRFHSWLGQIGRAAAIALLWSSALPDQATWQSGVTNYCAAGGPLRDFFIGNALEVGPGTAPAVKDVESEHVLHLYSRIGKIYILQKRRNIHEILQSTEETEYQPAGKLSRMTDRLPDLRTDPAIIDNNRTDHGKDLVGIALEESWLTDGPVIVLSFDAG